MSKNLSVTLTDELRAYIERQAGDGTMYATPSEYIRDLIRKDREANEAEAFRQSVLKGYEDLGAGRFSKYEGMEKALIQGRQLLKESRKDV